MKTKKLLLALAAPLLVVSMLTGCGGSTPSVSSQDTSITTSDGGQSTSEESQTTSEESQTTSEESQATSEGEQSSSEDSQATSEGEQSISEDSQASFEESQTSSEESQSTSESEQTSSEESQSSSEGIEPIAWPGAEIETAMSFGYDIDYDTPDLSVEEATAYEVSGNVWEGVSVIYTLPEGADIDEVMGKLAGKLEGLGYVLDTNINCYGNGTLDIGMGTTGEGKLIVVFYAHEVPLIDFPTAEIKACLPDQNVSIPFRSVYGVASYNVFQVDDDAVVEVHHDGKFTNARIQDSMIQTLTDSGYLRINDEGNPQYWNWELLVTFAEVNEDWFVVSFSVAKVPLKSNSYGIVFKSAHWNIAEFDQEIDGHKQYLIDDCCFDKGERFYIVDFSNHNVFWPTFENAEGLVEYEEATGYYVVLKDFYADVYLKLKWQDDSVYFTNVLEF